MTDPDLDVDLDHPVAEVGGVFRGRIHRAGRVDDLVERTNRRVRAIELSLRYRAEGVGITDRATAATVQFPVDDYGRAGGRFELPVPGGDPISYDGALFRVRWEIEARVDTRWAFDPKTTIPVLVIPVGGLARYHAPHPLRW